MGAFALALVLSGCDDHGAGSAPAPSLDQGAAVGDAGAGVDDARAVDRDASDASPGDALAPPPAPRRDWQAVVEDAPQGAFLGVWGRDPNEVYFVGGQLDKPVIGRWDGEAITWMDPPGHRRAWWVFGLEEPARMYVVGEGGLGLTRTGDGPWVEWPTGVTDQTLYGVWGTAPDDLWVVGGDPARGGPAVLRHWDGGAWTDAVLPDLGPEEAPAAWFKVWGSGDGPVFVAGDRGVMLRYDGEAWSRVPAPPVDVVLTVHGRDANDVWAVGGRARGVMLHFDGAAWRAVTPSEDLSGLAGVYAAADGSLVTSGNFGLLMQRDAAGNWRTLRTATRDLLHAVWVAPNGERWAVGGNLMQPDGPHHGIILHGEGVGATPPPPADAGAPPPPPSTCDPSWVRGRGIHRLYLQGREGVPDALGRYPFFEDEADIVHGEHYLLGEGAFAEWVTWLCGDLNANVFFYIPNNDDVGSRALHQLYRVRDGVETLIAETIDDQSGESGYNPFTDRPPAVDVQAQAGDELLLRSTNLNGVMYSVMIFHPPSEYMSYLEIELTEDGPPVGDPRGGPDGDRPCQPGLEIGGGQEAFEPMDADGTAPLVIGPQGSYMIFLGLRARGIDGGDPDEPLDPGNPLVELSAHTEDQPVGNVRQRIGFRPDRGDRLSAPGLILTVNPNLQAADLMGAAVTVEASVTDRNGVRICGEQIIVPTRP